MGSGSYSPTQQGIPTHRYGGPGNSYVAHIRQAILAYISLTRQVQGQWLTVMSTASGNAQLAALVATKVALQLAHISIAYPRDGNRTNLGIVRDSFGDSATYKFGVEPNSRAVLYITITRNRGFKDLVRRG